MSDWGAVNDRVKGLEAGLELEMPASGGDNDAMIVKAVKDGALEEKILDQAVERILRIILNMQTIVSPRNLPWKRIMKRLSILQKNPWSF